MRLAPYLHRVATRLPVLAVCLAMVPESFAWELFSSSKPEGPAASQSAPAGANEAASARRGPLFRGYEVRMPDMPFARQKPATKPAPGRPQMADQRIATRANSQAASRASGPTMPMQQMPQRMSHAPPQAPVHPQRGPIAAQGGMARSGFRPQQSVPQRSPDRTVRPASSERALPTSTTEQTASAYIGREKAELTRIATAAAAPSSPAEKLLAQAHEWSGSAATEADYTRIIDACARARTSQPDAATDRYANQLASWAFNRRGQIKADAGLHQEAIADFDEAIRADRSRWRALHNRGVLLAQSGEFERAFDDFARTIQLNPKFAKAYSNRAALYMVAGELETALDDFRHAVELNPELAVAQRGCGRACHLLRQLDQALLHYNEAVRLAPTDAYAVACRADLLTDLGRYADAAAEYERTIRLDPKSGHAYSSSAWLLATCPDASVRNPQLAVERAKFAISLTGDGDAASFDTLAAAQACAGDFTAAVESVRQAVELAPPEERGIYEQRLVMYQHAKPYRIAPIGEVVQASYQDE